MTLRILLIAATALISLCAADVSHINHETPKDVLVPFNDLLPPPLEESTSAEPEPTPVTKPTKKSYYQQQARSKETHQIDEKPSASASSSSSSTSNKQPELQLALDLLPPFVEAPSNNDEVEVQPQAEQVSTTTQQPLVTNRNTPTTTTERRVPHAIKPHLLQARVSRPNSISSISPSSSIGATKSELSPSLIAQYATYFQFTTSRPPRGPLPTLTPFPHHIKN